MLNSQRGGYQEGHQELPGLGGIASEKARCEVCSKARAGPWKARKRHSQRIRKLRKTRRFFQTAGRSILTFSRVADRILYPANCALCRAFCLVGRPLALKLLISRQLADALFDCALCLVGGASDSIFVHHGHSPLRLRERPACIFGSTVRCAPKHSHRCVRQDGDSAATSSPQLSWNERNTASEATPD
jgi:hypothetical protein